MKKHFLLLALTATASSVWAHPGHGTGNPLSPGHYVGNPEHSIPITLAIATGIILVNWLAFKVIRKHSK